MKNRLSAAPDDNSGGNPPKTLKDQLADANLRIAELEPKSKLAEDLQTKLTDSEGKVTKLEGEAKTASEKITKLEGEAKDAGDKITKLEADAKDATAKIEKLGGDVKTAEGRVTKLKETAAAHGITGLENESAQHQASAGDGAALYDEYTKLTGRAKTAFFAKNEKALLAYADSEAKGK